MSIRIHCRLQSEITNWLSEYLTQETRGTSEITNVLIYRNVDVAYELIYH